MDRKSIVTLPAKVLRERAKRVRVIDADIKKLAEGMKQASLDWEDHRKNEVAAALAAPQIGQSVRVIIVRNDFSDSKDRGFQVFINPEITKHEGELVEDYEGCLSIKDIYGKVKRHSKVRVKAKGLDGREFRVTAEGFLARVFQHEIDHVKGTVFIDHIKDTPEAFFKLNSEGKLEPLNYDKDVKNNRLLW